MEDVYAWFDPHEEKVRADYNARRVNSAYSEGRRAVEDMISRATREGLSQKVDAALDGLADQIARRIAYDLGAKMAYRYVSEREIQPVADAFRRACKDVLNGLELPEASRVRASFPVDILSATATMQIEYETMRPLQVAYRIRL